MAPFPPMAAHQPPLLSQLKFNALGVDSLRFHLNKIDGANLYRHYPARFDSADLAWFVAGVHKDGDHDTAPDAFHSLWKIACETQQVNDPQIERSRFRDRVRDLVFDSVSCVALSYRLLLT